MPRRSHQAHPTRRITIEVPVRGMTCRSCEVRIERLVSRLQDVEKVTASAVRGRVTIESSAPVAPAAIEEAIGTAGYAIGRTPWLERDPKVWLTAGAGVLLVAVLALMARATGLTGIASGAGELRSGGLVVAVMLGLAAGVSTCAVLVGGLVLALSASLQARRAAAGDRDPGLGRRLRPALVFVGGRIAGYAVLGAALGAVGASVTMPPQLTALLMVTVACVMMVLGTRLTGLSPRVATWSPTLPAGLGRRLGIGPGADALSSYSDARAAGLGAASFFVPCGFTQAVQIYALSTGSPVFAGAIMAAFAIGTAPGLLALAGLPVIVPGRTRPALLRLVGVAVVGFAVLNAGAGLRLADATLLAPGAGAVEAAVLPEGSTQPPAADPESTTNVGQPYTATGLPPSPAATPRRATPSPRPTATATPRATPPSVQALRTFQDVDGYSPYDAIIYAGMPTRWTIESRSVDTCAGYLFVPDLGIQVFLEKGDGNVIDLPALKPGRLDYTCSMGMFWATITVIDRPAATTGAGG